MPILHFLATCDALKRIPRTGWLLRDVPPAAAETVAEHLHTTAVVAYLLALLSGEKVDSSRLLLMALLHDLPEAKIGDIPRDASSMLPRLGQAKQAAEQQAMKALLDDLPAQLQTPLSAAWEDYSRGSSREARIVEAADRVATVVHVLHLVKAGYRKDAFEPFIDHAQETVAALHIPAADELVKDLRRTVGL